MNTLEDFLDKYLSVTNKTNVICIKLHNLITDNISVIKLTKEEISDFIKNIKQRYNESITIKKGINYKYDSIEMNVCNNNQVNKESFLNDSLSTIFNKKNIIITQYTVNIINNTVSVNQFADIKTKEDIVINLKLLDVIIQYNSDDDYGTVCMIIKKPVDKNIIVKLIYDILDY